MSYTFEDLEKELVKSARSVSIDIIAKAVNKLGGSLKIYQSGAVKKEILARIPLKKYKKVELCIYMQEPFNRMAIYEQGKYTEVERKAFNLPQMFVSIWLEDLEGKKHIGPSLIPPNPDFTYLELSELTLHKEIYDESRELAYGLIRLLGAYCS